MFLRSLTLRGFKSFAEKTTLEFAPGTSVVVGPNGSGKSNLVDAIAWVLGEQGPRTLRGAQMADVIFAGSPARPALGMAEVTLVIDNEAGLIPVPDAEIEVGRVVYRSGVSEYMVAGKNTRLMDIQELLSDTGIGRTLHTVVGQGQLEDVLTARPEERREFIEEAAGIAKHRRRKERAQRKLLRLDQDLLRLQDVMVELKRRLRPLKQQAEAATKYEALQREADSLAWRLAAARLAALYAERERGRPAWEEGSARRREADERLRRLDERIVRLADDLAAAERRLSEGEAAVGHAERERSGAEAVLREAVQAEAQARATLAEEAGRSGRLSAIEEDARQLETRLAEASAALDQGERDLAKAERAYAAAERARRDAEEARHHARERTIARRAEAQTLRRSLELSHAERERLTSALAEVRRREEEARRERDALEEEIERLDAESTPVADRLQGLQREEQRLSDDIAGLEGDERTLDGHGQALETRRRALAETPGRRYLKRPRQQAVGLLAELIEVQRGFERAVAAALGPMADAVVYPGHADAVSVADEAGGATFAVMADAPPVFVLPRERRLLSVVKADPRARGAVAAVLRHVYLASDRTDALEKHRRHPAASFVTPDGVLVGPAVVRTAPAPSDEEIAIRREVVATERDLGVLRRDLRSKREALQRSRAERASVEDALRRTDVLITAAADRMARTDADLAALRREREVLEHRLAGVDEHVGSATEALGEAPEGVDDELPELPPAPEAPIALRAEVELRRRDRRRLEEALAARRVERSRAAQGDPAALRVALERSAQARMVAEATLAEAESRLAVARSERDEGVRAVAGLRAAEAEANRGWREAAALLQRLRDEYEDQDQARRDVDRRIEEAERVLREGHERDPAEAVAALGEDDAIESLAKRSDLVARRLGLLGRVNLVATEEYRELQERHDFLQREIDDVRSARRDLQQVIREVDRKVVEIFDAAFRDVAAEFERLFGKLFPGGEGRIALTDPGNLLESGIEIEARPGRKKVNRLSLLSGGERALSAIAFLFAIFRARPSPFYLLDEVEAALDDINLHRFIDLVKEFAETSQVILVTHQKRTMEAADVLYGVSMGKDGSTRVIAQRVADAVPG